MCVCVCVCTHHIIAPLLLDWLSSSRHPPLGISQPINLTLLLSSSICRPPTTCSWQLQLAPHLKVFSSDFYSYKASSCQQTIRYARGATCAVGASVRLHHHHHQGATEDLLACQIGFVFMQSESGVYDVYLRRIWDRLHQILLFPSPSFCPSRPVGFITSL